MKFCSAVIVQKKAKIAILPDCWTLTFSWVSKRNGLSDGFYRPAPSSGTLNFTSWAAEPKINLIHC